MTPTNQGSIRLFRVAGINVFLHWSWFLVAAIAMQQRTGLYRSPAWNIAEYLSLFGIVLLHEFGHALACRQVGGQAEQIVLWPLGGVAYVSPPQRPGAVLWSIAAGPLVNVVLVPTFLAVGYACRTAGLWDTMPDAHAFLRTVAIINLGLLIFNILPIYPLDGGQILRALLWFPLGRANSLMVATGIGFVGVAGVIVLALLWQSLWIGIIAAFILMNCWRGWQQARALSKLAKMPRHEGFACPSCGAAPVKGAFWGCGKCRTAFDTFETRAVCPQCGTQFEATKCLECGSIHSMGEWAATTAVQPNA
jgi:Zn-dependent protease